MRTNRPGMAKHRKRGINLSPAWQRATIARPAPKENGRRRGSHSRSRPYPGPGLGVRWSRFRSDVDAAGDLFQLADAFLQIGDLDPSVRGRKAMVAGLAGQFEPFEVEPVLPSLEAVAR